MRRNSPTQKGVHALFTAPKERKRGNTGAVGLATAIVGACVWVWALMVFLGMVEPILISDRTSSSIMMLSIAVPLIAVGSTTFAYSHATRDSTNDATDSESLAREVEALTAPRIGSPQSYQPVMQRSRRQRRAEILAIIEGLMIVLLYGGLLREYDSSIYMREWVQENIPLATFVLNDNIFFLVVGVLLATLAFHLASRKNAQ